MTSHQQHQQQPTQPDELLTFLIRTRNMLEVEAGAAAAQGIQGMVVAEMEESIICLARAIDYHRKSKDKLKSSMSQAIEQ